MNRFKLVVLLILAGIVGILFVQNQQLLTLKLFCPEPTSEACFFLSPELSLAAWMGLFAIAGILSSLLGQLLNRATSTKTVVAKSVASKPKEQPYSRTKFSKNKTKKSGFNDSGFNNSNSSAPKKAPKNDNSSRKNSAATDWEEKRSENWEEDKFSETTKSPQKDRVVTQETKTQTKSPTKPTSSDSVYSYKFSESSKNKPTESTESNKNKTDDVYDASYRTINNPSPKNETPQEENDEEWI